MSPDLQAQLQRGLGDAYEIERELGGGGMSRVYVARDQSLGRTVVVKLLSPELAADVNIDRFRREITLAAQLQHACIVPLLSAGSAEGLPYFTMPLVEGETLRARLAREGPLPLPDAVRILRDAAEALSHAHERGVIHRDIKPENILLTRHHALVSDFGVAKAVSAAAVSPAPGGHITSHGLVLGTPAYMAPEQAMGDPTTDHRADLYALGLVAYEMLTGAHPFPGVTGQKLLAAHAFETPAPLRDLRAEVPTELASLVTACLEKDPAKRPRSADELLARLDAIPLARTDAMRPLPGRRRAAIAVLAAALAAVLLVAAVVGAWRLRAPSAAWSGASPAAIPSIAVLPFANVSARPDDEYLSDGITDELIGALGTIEGLRTAARSASFVFKGKDVQALDVGRQLRVSAVLNGSVRRDGNRLRVMAQLISTKDGLSLWQRSFEGEMQDVFTVQDQIARAIVDSLRVIAGGIPVARRVRHLDAYDQYLRGRFAYNKFTEEDLRQSLRYYARALELDSTYAPAWAGIAEAYISLADDWLPPRDAYPLAKTAALRALFLDSTLAAAHASLGTIHMSFDWDFAAAEREFRVARRLRPNDPWAYNQVATLLLRVGGREREALAEIDRARLLDSLDVTYQAGLASGLLWLRRYDEAIAAGRRALAMEEKGGIHIIIGDAQLASDRAAEALHSFRRAEALGYIRAPEAIARALVAMGDTLAARRIAGQLEARAGGRYVRAEYIARVWAALGDRDRAFAWLDSAYEQRSAGLTWLRVHPAYDPLRSDPRFERLLERARLDQPPSASADRGAVRHRALEREEHHLAA